MRSRRCGFVPQIDVLSLRIVPHWGAATAAAVDAVTMVAPTDPPTIAPDGSDDDGSDNVTDPGYGDVGTNGLDASSDGSDASGDGSPTDGGDNSGAGSVDGSTTDAALDGLDDGNPDGSGDDDSESGSSPYLDDQEFTVAIAVYAVSPY